MSVTATRTVSVSGADGEPVGTLAAGCTWQYVSPVLDSTTACAVAHARSTTLHCTWKLWLICGLRPLLLVPLPLPVEAMEGVSARVNFSPLLA